jgi:hypothetical protein
MPVPDDAITVGRAPRFVHPAAAVLGGLSPPPRTPEGARQCSTGSQDDPEWGNGIDSSIGSDSGSGNASVEHRASPARMAVATEAARASAGGVPTVPAPGKASAPGLVVAGRGGPQDAPAAGRGASGSTGGASTGLFGLPLHTRALPLPAPIDTQARVSRVGAVAGARSAVRVPSATQPGGPVGNQGRTGAGGQT